MKTYSELRSINVNEHTEKKGNLTYLSWAWAVDTLLQNDPSATWFYIEPVKFNETMMVFCRVDAFGKSMTAQLPVMDYKNKAISNPDAMSVNTAMQRCLAKAIALHGIGLYIYSGEDVPNIETEVVDVTDIVVALAESADVDALKKIYLSAVKFCDGNQDALKLILDAKDSRKKALETK
jgi:hypothetical protein